MAIKQGVPESELASFRFPSDKKSQEKMGIRWLEDREFAYNGNMYDVVHKQVDDDFIIYKCVNDTQEKMLFAGLGKQIKNTMNSDPSKSKTLNLLQKFNLLYYPENKINLEFLQSETHLSYCFNPQFYYNLSKEVITPPPRFS